MVGFLSPELVLTGVSYPVLYFASYASSSLTVCSYSFIIKSKYFQNIKSCELIPSFMFCCFSINCVPSFVTSFAWTSSWSIYLCVQISGYLCVGSFSGFRRGFNPSRELSSNSFFNLYQNRCSFFGPLHENQLFSVFFSFATAARLILIFHLPIASLFCFKKIYLGTSILLRSLTVV